MSTLIVPIDLTALCVGQPDCATPASLAPLADFALLPQANGSAAPYLTTDVTAAAGPFSGEVYFTPGVYLHWALPDALTSGDGTGDQLSFPAVPDRWLLSRILQDTSTTPATATVTSWVIESDRLTTPTPGQAPPQPTVPLADPSATPNYMGIGASFPLSGWGETTADRLEPLTALGYGEPTFASYFPNCATVFGYVDTLADVADYDPAGSTLTYQVSGWYADPSDDPLGAGTAQPNAVTAQWSYTGAPTQTVLSGMVTGVAWNAATPYLTDAPGPLTVAVAASAPEALSAMMASVLQGAEFQGAESLLNALQFGLLGPAGTIGSLAEFEQDVQAAGFGTLPAGTTWAVVPASSAGGDQDTGRIPSEVTLDPALAAQLDALNTAQAGVDALTRQLQALQWQLFTDWNKYLVVLYQGSATGTLDDQGPAVQTYLQNEVDAIGAIAAPQTGTLATAQAAVDAQAQALSAALPAGFTLLATPAASFQQPHDPVLLLAGPDVTPVGRYGNDGADSADGLLPCRTDDALVSSLTLGAGVVTGSAQVAVDGAALPALAALPAGTPGSVLQACMQEAFFLCAPLQPSLLGAVAAAGGDDNPAVLDPSDTLSALQSGAAAFLAGEGTGLLAYGGTAPDALLLNAWTGTPWLPLMLQYEVEFTPVQAVVPQDATEGYQPDFLTSQFALAAESLDLTYTGAAPSGGAQVYSGTIVLTDRAGYDLAQAIQSYTTAVPDPELTDLLPQVQSLQQLSQGLGGLTQSMLMQQMTLQVPVADPFADFDQAFVQAVGAAVAGQTVVAPMPDDSFNPIRTGTFAIQRLRLVDVFGRWKDYPAPQVVVSQGLAPPSGLSLPAGTAFLPPRIAQPARLLFDWVSAEDREVETNTHPATSPVIGIIVPNFLDRSLLVYTASGTPLVVLAPGGSQVNATPAPGGAYPMDTQLSTVLDGQNADLAAFVSATAGASLDDFTALLDAVQTALASTLPAAFRQSAGLAVLTGNPLVLARAALGLDLAGPPATDESWTSFAASVLNGAAPNDFGWSAVNFPVVLGAADDLQDTLVGYFLEPGGVTDYTTLYVPGATAAGGVQPPALDTVTLLPGSGGTAATTVLMLLDPRGTVHATSGVLPVQPLQIPPDQYAAALAALSLSFTAGPVLTGVAGIATPRMVAPQVGSGSWSWVAESGGAWVTQPLASAPPTQASLDYSPQTVADGWLSLAPAPSSSTT